MSILYPFNDPRAIEANPPTVMVSGDGIRVTDAEGRTFIDAVAGLWCASLGFSNEALAAAAARQLRTLPYYHSFMGRTAEPAVELAERLTALVPAPLAHVFFGCTGSDAVDTAIKLVWYANNARGRSAKKRIIARQSAYHGSGLMSAGLTAFAYCHDGFDTESPLVLRAASPDYFTHRQPGESERDFSRRLAKELDQQIVEAGADSIGAFIGEPVIGSGGVILPPEGYWAEIQDVLAKHDILLIADETITGFGRTGQWFASTLYGIRPDIMTTAKQLSGAYIPISAVFLSDDLYQTIADSAHEKKTFGHGFTYGGHPVAAAVALAAINEYERMDLTSHVSGLGRHLRARMTTLGQSPDVAHLRSVGLMAGVQLTPWSEGLGSHGQSVLREAEKRGVLFRAVDDTIVISPPFIITEEEIDLLIETLAESIAAAGAPMDCAEVAV